MADVGSEATIVALATEFPPSVLWSTTMFRGRVGMVK